MAASVSLVVARALGLEFPLYSFLAAVIVTDLSPAQTRRLGGRRVGATVIGATCGAALSQVLPAGPWAAGLGVLVAMLACNLVHMQESAKVAGYISGIILLAYGAEPWSYAVVRLLETMLGVGVAWVISLVPKLIGLDEPGHRDG